jgi:ABC-type transporter MlaC component
MEPQTFRRRTILLASIASLTIVACPGSGAALATPAGSSEKLVHDAANQFLEVMRHGAHRHKIADALNRYVAVGAMALFVLGKHRRLLKPGQKQNYIGLFKNMVLKALTKHGKKVRGKAFVVTASHRNIVKGYIQHDQDRRTELEFRTKENRIMDIRIEGIWVSILLRQSFDHVISQGGNIDAIFVYLKSGKLPL